MDAAPAKSRTQAGVHSPCVLSGAYRPGRLPLVCRHKPTSSDRQGGYVRFMNGRRPAGSCSLSAALLMLAPLAQAQSAPAQDYPNRAVTLVVPYPAGGGLDALARLLGQKLADRLGKPVVIENRTGAGTVIGAASVAKAAPDGYTIMLGTSTPFAITATLNKSLPYDPGQGLRADRAHLQRAVPAAGASIAAGALGGRSRQAREVEARATLLRIGRPGLAATPELRAAQEHDRHRRRARALSRRRAGADRPGRRSHSDDVRRADPDPAAAQGRPGARARRVVRDRACRSRRTFPRSPRPASPVSTSPPGR